MAILAASKTHIGLVRKKNEDTFCQFEPDDETNLREKGWIFIVADGMGGHSGGEVASRIAVETIRNHYYFSAKNPPGALREAFLEANRRILAEAIRDSSLFGMGTTCTVLVIMREEAYFAHVGDSRAYLLRNGELKQVTQDHSIVGDMLRSGIISHEEARIHPQRNIITRSLGVHEGVMADIPDSPLVLEEEDIFMLCSDGLTSLVSDSDIKEILESSDPDEACGLLIDRANAAGGKDNITVQVIHFRPGEANK